MKNPLRFAIAVLLCAFAVWWYLRRTKDSRPTATAPTDAAVALAPAPAPADPTAPPRADPTAAADAPGFRRIDLAARRALLDRIAHAPGSAAPPPTAPPPAPLPGGFTVSSVVDGITPLFPAFQDCYEETRAKRTATSVSVTFDAMLVGDPTVGTLVESIKLDGDDAFRADPELATCLRETMLAVELPPMTGGNRASFHTTMLLSDDEPDAGP